MTWPGKTDYSIALFRAHQKLLDGPTASQSQSPFFRLLPSEVRDEIYRLALTDCPDLAAEKQYDADTCYTRPSYSAPRRSYTSLLLTCRAIYRECWFMPITLRELTFWLTNEDRAPPGALGVGHGSPSGRMLLSKLDMTASQLGEDAVEVESIRYFAQMYKLEENALCLSLRQLAKTPVHFRRLTLTIRHQDWWYWETDEPLRFAGQWIKNVCKELPPSVREINIEMESLERKKTQVDAIAQKMSERWFFRRADGDHLFADSKPGSREVTRWRGTSTWHGKRWVRDETEDNILDYYVVRVTFRPKHVIERGGGKLSAELAAANTQWRPSNENLPNLTLPQERPMEYGRPWISVDRGVPSALPVPPPASERRRRRLRFGAA